MSVQQAMESQGDRESGRVLWDETEGVIGALIEVHRALGPGLLESVYEACLCEELTNRGVSFDRQRPVGVRYKSVSIDCGFRLDVVVESRIVVEIKSVEQLLPIHQAQALTYLKLTGIPVALLVNFNVAVLRNGLRRLRLESSDPSPTPDLPVPSLPMRHRGR